MILCVINVAHLRRANESTMFVFYQRVMPTASSSLCCFVYKIGIMGSIRLFECLFMDAAILNLPPAPSATIDEWLVKTSLLIPTDGSVGAQRW